MFLWNVPFKKTHHLVCWSWFIAKDAEWYGVLFSSLVSLCRAGEEGKLFPAAYQRPLCPGVNTWPSGHEEYAMGLHINLVHLQYTYCNLRPLQKLKTSVHFSQGWKSLKSMADLP